MSGGAKIGDYLHAKSDPPPSASETVEVMAAALTKTLRGAMESQAAPQVTVNMPEQPVTFRMPEQPPANVHMHFAEQPPAPIVTVKMPEQPVPLVTVEPVINVLPPVPRAYDVRITERDERGFILAFRITPA